jgi:hypothetical protein
MTRFLSVALACLALASSPIGQQSRTALPAKKGSIEDRPFSGQVVDGLGRPIPRVKITVETKDRPGKKAPPTVLKTDDEGKYSGALTDDSDEWLAFECDGYAWESGGAAPGEIIVMKLLFDWDELLMLPIYRGDKLDAALRELLASAEWGYDDDGKLPGFLFKYELIFRPALRRILGDRHVGDSARDWLELLGDPADQDLFPKVRRYTPKKPVREPDLVQALKAPALLRNFNTSAPKPRIDIDFIAFREDLDGVLIQCGINRAAMTGRTWQFIFCRVDKHWELRSVKEAGRS